MRRRDPRMLSRGYKEIDSIEEIDYTLDHFNGARFKSARPITNVSYISFKLGINFFTNW